MHKPRIYQSNDVSRIKSSFAKKVKSVLYVLPTGGGKTFTFTYIANQASLKGKKVLILVHRIELLRQTSAALDKFGVSHGIINPKYTPNFSANIQVASVQTLIKRLSYFAALGWEADILVCDEAHHSTAGSWRKIIEHFINAYLLGVTATPIRTDGQGLGREFGGMFDELIEGPSISWLIDEGYLVRPRVFGTPEKIDLSGVHSQMGDYKVFELADLVDKPKIIGSAVEHYKEIAFGKPAIVFCVSVAHAEHVAQEFRNAGFKFYSVDGSMEGETRDRIINGLLNGSVQGVTSCDLISEGTDIPRATVAMELRPTQSKGLNMQQRGRVLRPVYAEGFDLSTKEGRLSAIAASEKPEAIILDHVGNTERHGLPHDIQEWSLEGNKKSKRSKKNEEAPVRVVMCESCFMQQEPALVCISCGHVMKKPVDNTPKQVEGKLKEITSIDIIKKRESRKEQGKANSMEALLKIAKERGFNENWAKHVYDGRMKKLEKLEALKTPVILETETVLGFTENLDF